MHVFQLRPVASHLERARRHLSTSSRVDDGLQRPAEWFLDNFYLIRRVARQVEEELPPAFMAVLPLLTEGIGRGRPRIDVLANSLVTVSAMVLEAATLKRFIDAYQEVETLTIGELWALPGMLRAAVLEGLLAFLDELDVPGRVKGRSSSEVVAGAAAGPKALGPPDQLDPTRPVSPLASRGQVGPFGPIDPETGVERAIRALRVLDTVDWKVFFEASSRVEAVLRTDPSRIYPRMDFETCDAYRKAVEALAWATETPEGAVADLAIALSVAGGDDERRGHVGYYLIAEGRHLLEEQLGYRPVGMERVRRSITGSPTAAYLVPLALLTWIPLLIAVWAIVAPHDGLSFVAFAVAIAVTVVPFSALVVTLLHMVFARLLPPRTLPKLDLKHGVPIDMGTLIVIPTLLGRDDDVTSMLAQLELHYLSNPDPRIQFALLTDDLDAKLPRDVSTPRPLLERVSRGIDALNVRHGDAGRGPFHLLHRDPLWNAAEGRFMGWERKRGKLEELNRLLRGDTKTTYSRHVGDPQGLLGIRFVITLDSDTELPMGAAHRLVGLLAHPLNHAVFDPGTGRVTAGYTVVQPRVETSPSSARTTRFSRLFAGDVGFDIYTRACSELYQDLFGAGIYVGKGIYDVDGFIRSVDGQAPENALVSHDLFEGIHGRAALATDIVLFESYPESYATYAMRKHRWVRGDWQLFPWLRGKVPCASGGKLPNTLARIDRWKILDNLRRSLSGPFIVLLLILGWLWLPGGALAWTLTALGLHFAPSIHALVFGNRTRMVELGRGGLGVVFAAFEASVVLDAIIRVFVRKLITRRDLLQWTSAANAAFGIASRSPRALFWQTLIVSPIIAIVVGALIAWLNPSSFWVAMPFLLMWSLAPEIARWVSRPRTVEVERLAAPDRSELRLLARRTWRFFDVFVGPGDQWLPIDNYQDSPREQTAHRTSPTNIGLTLLATLSAYDFGYVGPSELSLRIRRAFDSIARLPHYQGHLFNWYDTRNLRALLPSYVSTVDSGNFAGCLVALRQGCLDVANAPVDRPEAWDGLRDSIALLQEVVDLIPGASVDRLRSVITRMFAATTAGQAHPLDAYATLKSLCEQTSSELDSELLTFLESGLHRHEGELLQDLRTTIERLHKQLRQMRGELDTLLPWLALSDDLLAHGLVLPTSVRLSEIPAIARLRRAALEASEEVRRAKGVPAPELDASARRLREALRLAEANAVALLGEFTALAALAAAEIAGMDFKILYDRERRLFHIGYNATTDQLDAHYYDLLASEARLASYLAIVKRDVPPSHWYALGRPMTTLNGEPALLSWGGTMFEYLMPGLLMKSHENTLLARTCAAVVDAQIRYAKSDNGLWGISESAYALVDAEETYQYRSFGVPGLGFKRGLEDDRVIAPYASVLAVSIRPQAVVENLATLRKHGMCGTYGLFEALDLTSDRALWHQPHERPFAIVRSYMAHHQGMLLVALGNVLNGRTMVDRFHADPLVQTGEVLLNERAPASTPREWPIAAELEPEEVVEVPPALLPPPCWSAQQGDGPHAFVLSNGRLTSVLTDSGGGGLRWGELALTRFETDATRDDDGLWLYLRDEQSRHVWLATSAAGRTTYWMHKAELHHREQGISAHVAITVAAVDDVEVRLVTLHNETSERRRLTLTSAGRPVLFDAVRAPSHPAFSSLFVQSEAVTELQGLLFWRRPQDTKEEPAVLVHRVVFEGPQVRLVGFESDRSAFYGRGGSLAAPQALTREGMELGGGVGAVLDPIMSLMAAVELDPNESVSLAFVTTVGRTRAVATELAQKYGTIHAAKWAFRDAEQDSPRRLQRTRLDPTLYPTVQRFFSALLYADAALRVSPNERTSVPPRQRRLWGRGISGDLPIALVRVHDPVAPLVREVLASQRYLRSCGVSLDLVLVDQQASGYAGDAAGTLANVLATSEVGDWLNRSGGVFVVTADQVAGDEIRHLESCARVLLDTREDSLAAPLWRRVVKPPALPHFEATLNRDASYPPAPVRRPQLAFDNGLGGFAEDGREYVIDVLPGAPTPAPWSNVLANPDFGCLVTESSFGTTWSLNSGENRLTPWRNDPVFDTPSEVLYLRDEETADVWSSTPHPAGQASPTRVRHGAGYTVYERQCHGLTQEMTVFVPRGASLKVVRLRVTNTLARHRRLTATYFAEWVLGSRREAQRSFVVSEFDRDHACLMATCHWNDEFGGRVAFLASKCPAHGYTADRGEFLGRRGDYGRPEALERWGLSNRVDLGNDPCATLQVHLELAPGETLETHFLLGQTSGRDEALELVGRFRDDAVVEDAWTQLQRYWDDLLGTVRLKTPEPSTDLLINRWLLYQTLSARLFGRTGFYQSSGAFGFRDQLQDVQALLLVAPAMARAHILEAARHQFEQGDVLHWWHPPSGRGVRTRCSDDLAWLPFVTADYVAATGDVGILDVDVPFLTGEPLRDDEADRYAQYETSATMAPLLEHCRRALEHAITQGIHGLPLMGSGDWNDGMSRIGAAGRGESTWLAWFLCATMDRFDDLLTRAGHTVEKPDWRARADALRKTIDDAAWDGHWYVRAFHDDGSLVGSAKSRECRIDSIAQSWSILSRPTVALGRSEAAATPPRQDVRAREALHEADGQLVRDADRLVLLFWPPFDTTSHDPGYVRAYPPGIRENGGQYTHAAAWLGLAHAALGDGENAERIFRLLNPILRTTSAADAATYRVEPYVVAADIYSCPPWVGRGGWTWYTGSAAWVWRLGVEAIAGITRVDGALRIDPCIPPRWDGFEAWIRLGACELHVVVENPEHVARGVALMTVDGAALAADRIVVDETTEGVHEVRVRLGRVV